MKITCYEDIIVWQKAMQLAKMVYLQKKSVNLS